MLMMTLKEVEITVTQHSRDY